MIRIFNSAYGRNSAERLLELDEVNIVSQKINYMGRPYILFEHKDYPLGALRAEYDGEVWSCDLD
jgi:hypothetical protein